jgi:hypothetical protein
MEWAWVKSVTAFPKGSDLPVSEEHRGGRYQRSIQEYNKLRTSNHHACLIPSFIFVLRHHLQRSSLFGDALLLPSFLYTVSSSFSRGNLSVLSFVVCSIPRFPPIASNGYPCCASNGSFPPIASNGYLDFNSLCAVQVFVKSLLRLLFRLSLCSTFHYVLTLEGRIQYWSFLSIVL